MGTGTPPASSGLEGLLGGGATRGATALGRREWASLSIQSNAPAYRYLGMFRASSLPSIRRPWRVSSTRHTRCHGIRTVPPGNSIAMPWGPARSLCDERRPIHQPLWLRRFQGRGASGFRVVRVRDPMRRRLRLQGRMMPSTQYGDGDGRPERTGMKRHSRACFTIEHPTGRVVRVFGGVTNEEGPSVWRA